MGSQTVLHEAKRLYRLGYAIHWLRPQSKVPLESGWTTGPRKAWADLKNSYSETLNVGVRLGTPSHVDDRGYLAVVDVDIKSQEDHHRKEALKAARSVLKGAPCPVALSGRGNGSRHYYCVTEKPFKGFDAFKSKELVKVHMPSSERVSKRDRDHLTAKEIASGIRIRPAWEISIMSEGRQVVLPPSIHPDSKQPYLWKSSPESVTDLPVVQFDVQPVDSTPGIEKIKDVSPLVAVPDEMKDKPFQVAPVELAWIDMSDKVRKAILTGEGVSDRSAYLLPASSALISAGLTRDEVLTVLTDRTTYLGECAYEHAQTEDRARAAAWVYRYTLKRVAQERDPISAFKSAGPVEPVKRLNEEEAAAQAEELGGQDDPEARGYYFTGAKGGLRPDYESLFNAFCERFPFKTIADMKYVYVFNGTHYVDFSPIEIKGFAEDKFNPKPEEKFRSEFHSKVLANHITRRAFFTETIEGKINFKNGVLDLNAGEKLISHRPDFGFRSVLPYAFDPEAKCPVFKDWLSGIMMGDVELARVLQEFMGYIVRGGEYKYHKALWLGGIGRNGKSTFIDLLKALIGPGNYSTISIKSLVGDKFAGADLDGKIANFSEETSPQELADSGPFKNLTGDGEIFAQKKYGDPYSFRNRAKIIMTYNRIPDLKDLSAGMLSRPIIVPFRKIIADDEQDRGIKAKLYAELPGIFNFALRGWKRLERRNGFTKSEVSDTALKNVKEESCSVFQWIENYIEFTEDNVNDPQERIFKPHELYTAYCARERHPFRSVEFYRRLNDHPKMNQCRKRAREGTSYACLKIR